MTILNEIPSGHFGYFHKQPNSSQLENMLSSDGLGFLFTKSGNIIIGPNIDLMKKVSRVLKEKRRQHKDRYLNSLKIYYMLVSWAPLQFRGINHDEILREMNEREIVVISHVFGMNQKLIDNKLAYFRDKRIIIDFTNKFYE